MGGRPYREFALFYDRCVGRQYYMAWQVYFEELTERHGIEYQRVLDAGCGTGLMVKYFIDHGKEAWGFDISPEMLEEAKKRNKGNGAKLFIASFTDFDLSITFDLITCNYDSLNYLIEDGELREALSRFHRHLAPRGHLIFDINTTYNLEHEWGDEKVFLHGDEEVTSVWKTSWEGEKKVNTLLMINFLKGPDGLYRRSEELHPERGYEVEEVLGLLKELGFTDLHAYDLDTDPLSPPTEKSGRVVFLAKRD